MCILHVGKMSAAELGFDPTAAINTAVHATLARCLHTLNVIRTIGMFHEGVIPRNARFCNTASCAGLLRPVTGFPQSDSSAGSLILCCQVTVSPTTAYAG